MRPVLIAPLALLALPACDTNTIDFAIAPNPVAFGQVDFAVEMPTDGYAPIATSLTNNGTKTVTLTLEDWDSDYLCVQGYSHDNLPGVMAPVDPGAAYVLNIAVCGYLPGERGTEVDTNVTIGTDSTPSTFPIPVTFTPLMSGGDTG